MKTQSARTACAVLALLIALITFALVAAVSRHPFERLPHLEDEVAYLYEAKIFAGGHLVIPSPEPHRSYWQPFVLDQDGVRFGKYSPGWPLLLAVGVLLGQPWIVNAFLAALAAALTYRLGRDLFGAEAGLIAALLLAISPMYLLLSGSLMGHTAATFFAVLLMVAFRQWERRGQARWAIAAGIALGLLINTRPLTAAGIALPFLLAAAWTFLRGAWQMRRRTGPPAHPGGITPGWGRQARLALIFSLAVGVVALLTPIYNAAATGDPAANLYTLVWQYDQIGFGPEFGRSGHTPEKALFNMQLDLALWSSDLFGWQMHEAVYTWLHEHTGWWLGLGLSWVLIPVGMLAKRKQRWAWLLLGTFVGLVGVHLLYWVGAQVYSARYYAEAVPALAILSAAGITALARRIHRPLVYGVLAVMVAANLLVYTPPRLGLLWRFNNVGADKIAALDALRDGRPVLILVTGQEQRSWRDWGAYMALTSPYLDSDVVAARDHGSPGERAAILARFPDRQVLYLPPDGVLRTSE